MQPGMKPFSWKHRKFSFIGKKVEPRFFTLQNLLFFQLHVITSMSYTPNNVDEWEETLNFFFVEGV